MSVKAINERKSYVRMKSRHGRLGYGYGHYAALWRNSESGFNRFERRASGLMARRSARLWETDPAPFWQSPFVAKPEQD